MPSQPFSIEPGRTGCGLPPFALLEPEKSLLKKRAPQSCSSFDAIAPHPSWHQNPLIDEVRALIDHRGL